MAIFEGWSCTSFCGRQFFSDGRSAGALLVPMAEEFLHIARRLADAMLILHQRHAHIAFAIFAKADARRHRDLGMDQQICLANSIEPASRYFSGTGAQANIEASGAGMSQPACAMLFTSTSRRDL